MTEEKTESMTEPTTEPISPLFEIRTIEDFKYIFTIARGGDPDAIQIVNKFLDIDSKVERSNLPTRNDVHFIAYLDFVSSSYFPKRPDNPFARLRDAVATASMAKGGWKSNTFVDIVRQSPDLAQLQSAGEAVQKVGLLSRLRGGSSE